MGTVVFINRHDVKSDYHRFSYTYEIDGRTYMLPDHLQQLEAVINHVLDHYTEIRFCFRWSDQFGDSE